MIAFSPGKGHHTVTVCMKDLINKTLPLYKAAYAGRGVPSKFDKVWGEGANSTTTASD